MHKIYILEFIDRYEDYKATVVAVYKDKDRADRAVVRLTEALEDYEHDSYFYTVTEHSIKDYRG